MGVLEELSLDGRAIVTTMLLGRMARTEIAADVLIRSTGT